MKRLIILVIIIAILYFLYRQAQLAEPFVSLNSPFWNKDTPNMNSQICNNMVNLRPFDDTEYGEDPDTWRWKEQHFPKWAYTVPTCPIDLDYG